MGELRLYFSTSEKAIGLKLLFGFIYIINNKQTALFFTGFDEDVEGVEEEGGEVEGIGREDVECGKRAFVREVGGRNDDPHVEDGA